MTEQFMKHEFHRHCDDCKWVAKAEIAMAICVHGAKCEVRRVVTVLKTDGASVHQAAGHIHFHMPNVFRFLRVAKVDPEDA